MTERYLYSHGYCQVVVLPRLTYTKINWTTSLQAGTNFEVFVSNAQSSSLCGVPVKALAGDPIVSQAGQPLIKVYSLKLGLTNWQQGTGCQVYDTTAKFSSHVDCELATLADRFDALWGCVPPWLISEKGQKLMTSSQSQ